MFNIFVRLQTQHDWRLVVLSVCVCGLACLSAINLYRRVGSDHTKPRLFWLGAAGGVTGCGIWATHLIGMLAYTPGFHVSFDLPLIVVSLFIAVTVVTGGLVIAAYGKAVWASLIGGVIVGLAAEVVYYLDLASLKMPAEVVWVPSLILLAIVSGIIFAALSLVVAQRKINVGGVLTSAGLLSLSVLSHHFISIGAMELILQPQFEAEAPWYSPLTISAAIGLVVITVVVASLISAMSDASSYRKIGERNIQLNAAVNNIMQGLCMFGPDGRLQVWNERYALMYNIPPEKIRAGCTAEDLFALRIEAGTILKGLDAYCAVLRRTLENRQGLRRIVELVDGRTVCVVYQTMENGGWVATHEDITERRRSEAKIEYLAQHDPLTGLANRIAFNDHLAGVWRKASSESNSFTILSLDIDRFSEINDTFSHAVGDGFLCEVARRLKAACGGAFIARLGGDEFVIISSDGPQPARAGDICTRALAAFAAPFFIDGNSISSGCTVGVSIFPQDGADVETLVTNADIALYRAKKEDRGSVRFFEPEMDREVREKRAMLRDLDLALSKHEFELHFQPLTQANGKLFGFEALVRWRHPERGLVSPGVFIPLAEETGLISAIDEWILREVCREAASWPNPLAIAINVSPISFRDGDLPSLLHAILLETGLDPKRLEIEITEGVLIEDFSRASSMLRRIKNLGVRLSMDDFGTGYSSLSYLQAFPFDKIKIDQTFVAQITKNPQSSTIIRAIIGLGQALDLRVIAEGVETEEQFSLLAAAGCTEMQGYLLGRPQPISAYGQAVGRIVPPQELLAG